MQIINRTVGKYLIFKVEDPIFANTDISDLCSRIEKSLEAGSIHIAVTFPVESHLSSRAIYVLLKCNELTKSKNGSFVFILPNKQITKMFDVLGLRKVIEVIESEDLLRD